MRVVKLLTAAIIASMLAACAGTPPPTTAIVTVEKPTLMLPNVDKVKLHDVDWNIVTKSAKPNTDGHIDNVWKKSSSDSLFAVTSRGYENLSINMAEMTRVVKQLQAQVQAYKDYYQTDNDKLKESKDNKDGKRQPTTATR
jgi:hypothetical protein